MRDKADKKIEKGVEMKKKEKNGEGKENEERCWPRKIKKIHTHAYTYANERLNEKEGNKSRKTDLKKFDKGRPCP